MVIAPTLTRGLRVSWRDYRTGRSAPGQTCKNNWRGPAEVIVADHHVYDVDTLRAAYFAIKRSAAAGIDGVTWKAYGENLEENLAELSARIKRGALRASAVRRVYIDKADGRRRSLGVPTLEDKIVQRAVVEVCNAIYETDFLGFSYGFRPGRNTHQALDALSVGIWERKVEWVLDADIRSFFDTLKHELTLEGVDSVCRAPNRGQAHRATHPKMAESRCAGGRRVDG